MKNLLNAASFLARNVSNPVHVSKNYLTGDSYQLRLRTGASFSGHRGDGLIGWLSEAEEQGFTVKDYGGGEYFRLVRDDLTVIGNNAEALASDFQYYQHPLIEGNHVVDVGGYLGETAIRFLNYGASGVTVYEPVRGNVHIIHLNTVHNDCVEQVDVVEAAVTDTSGKITIQSETAPGTDAFGCADGEHELTVDAVSWTEVVEDAIEKEATVMKIDAEGAEKHLIALSGERLQQIPFYSVETHSQEIRKKVQAFFEQNGFTVSMHNRHEYAGNELAILRAERNDN